MKISPGKNVCALILIIDYTRAMLKHSKASERMFCGVAALQSS